jgi:hypothetical protein
MKIASLGIAVALGAAPLVANAQVSVSGGISFNVGSVPGEPVASVDVFYDQLSPYGMWVDDPVVGQAFLPEEANYVPYTNGHWEMTDVGFVWVSSEPFAWATSHYGRWFYSDDYGRWMWVPDTTWGPNWVDWYEADGNFGWAPLAPQVVIESGYQTPYWAYRFAPSDRILSADVSRYYVPRDRVQTIRREARPITYRQQGHNHEVIVGPSPQALQAHRIQARPQKVDLKRVGRMNASDLRAAEQRAETRKPELQRQNAQRVEQHAQIKRAVETRASKAPANRQLNRNEPQPNRTQPENRAQPNRTQPENRAQPQNRTQPAQPQNRTQPAQPQNRTQPAQPQNRTQPEPARPESRGPTPGMNDRGDQNRARPTDQGDQNHTPRVRPDENPAEPKSVPLTPPTPERTPSRPEPKAAPTPKTAPLPPPTEERTPPRPEPKAEPTQRPQPTEMPRPEPKASRPEPSDMSRPESKSAPAPRPEPKASRPEPPPSREPASHPEPQSSREPASHAAPKGHPDNNKHDH